MLPEKIDPDILPDLEELIANFGVTLQSNDALVNSSDILVMIATMIYP